MWSDGLNTRRRGIGLLMLAGSLASPGLVAFQANEPQLLAEFDRRTGAYMAMHARIEAGLPALGLQTDAGQIETHQRLLAARIQQERSGAQPGDIFTPAIQDWLKRRLQTGFAGRDREAILQAIREEQEVQVELRVNTPFPDGVGLAGLPVALMRQLPPLPEALEYRVSDAHLVLWDGDANLVVDFIDHAL
jgi:hypothetical protein